MPRMAAPGPADEPVVAAGHIVALRLFDVAYAIDLSRAEALWAAQARRSGRLRLSGTPPKAVSFGVPPVTLELGPTRVGLGGETVEASVSARLFDFGAISLALRIDCAGLSWRGLAARMTAAYGLEGVPTFIVNGKYRIDGTTAGSEEGMFTALDQLVARELKAIGTH
jgi:hypothetical protein